MGKLDPENDWKPAISASEAPLYELLIEAIERDIRIGRLCPGDRLPTHRELADALGVGLSTITRALREAARRGFISGTVGRGTFVSGGTGQSGILGTPDFTGVVDLAVDRGFPGIGPDPTSALPAMESALSLLTDAPLHLGSLSHRETGAEWLNHLGVPSIPERTVICAGAQHAILCAMLVLCEPGDCALAGSLTYPGFRTAAAHLGVRIEPVETDSSGLLPDALERAVRRTNAKVLYVTPSVDNPTCVSLDINRREAIATIAQRYDIAVIEDETHRHSANDRLASFAEIIPERTVFVLGVSKSFSSALRTAFVITPAETLGPFEDAVWATAWSSSTLDTGFACQWISSGKASRGVAMRCEEAVQRQRMLASALHGLKIQTQRASHFAWVWLPDGVSPNSIKRMCATQGVRIGSPRAFSLGTEPDGLRICISSAKTRESLAEGLGILKGVIDQALQSRE